MKDLGLWRDVFLLNNDLNNVIANFPPARFAYYKKNVALLTFVRNAISTIVILQLQEFSFCVSANSEQWNTPCNKVPINEIVHFARDTAMRLKIRTIR